MQDQTNDTSIDATPVDESTERRFGGLTRLYGPASNIALQQSHVAVVGIGGVGSWVAEALARSGVGTLTLVDLDHVAESNINRQVHALTSTLGQAKVVAMAARIAGINAACHVKCVDDFLTPENVATVLPDDAAVVIDCTDQVSAKIAMVLHARARRLPLLVCGGAGGKTDLLSMRAGDLSEATHDALLARMRNLLRKSHGFPKPSNAAGKAKKRIPKMGVSVIWVDQPTILPDAWLLQKTTGDSEMASTLQGLSCAGYGSSVTVTGSMGFAAAAQAINIILNNKKVTR
ncbi:tRNA threonylcarbamoyladenosine dehydratase [Orrella sp. NBD-18]|uniref:tRNA threonylcarbamoyladenosine dehydratase n=1 Tax=Sheuella amnicola TaxID=2707330 RepID=A0A6B2QZ60_9BURK|nr:tRNA threonylcarbamoyladenosine dehydratase [Sheuella amnicola]NDY83008.1 tRNA threonylcarbamoyladenosine dehydratase [Sheuella amnicola]